MNKDSIIAAVVVAFVTASTTPWWWSKIFPDQTAEAAPVPRPVFTAPAPTATNRPDTVTPIGPTHCPAETPWFVQLGTGTDRSALVRVVDRIRATDARFRASALFESADGRYRMAIGCFTRFAADALAQSIVEEQVIANEPLVTLGRSLTRRVY